MKISRPGRLHIATLSLLLSATPVLSQGGPGLVGTLTIDQTLSYDSNSDFLVTPGDPKINSTTDLSFGITSDTRSESFSFRIGGAFDGAFGDGATSSDDLTFKNEFANVSYLRTGANSKLTLGASYSNIDIEDEVFGFFVDGIFDPDALIIDGGQRARTALSANLETGIEGPFGIEVDVKNTVVDYTNTSDPDLVDSDKQSVDVVANLRFNNGVNGRVLAGYARKDDSDAASTSSRTKYFGVGATAVTTTGLTLSADVTLDDAETFTFGLPNSNNSGVGIELEATQERADGTYGVSFASRVDNSGRRNTASVKRNVDLKDGSLSLSLGIADQNSDIEVTTSVTYTREWRDSQLTANLVQAPSTNDGDAQMNTSILLSYEKDINAVSSWDAEFSYGAASSFGVSDGDTRASASLGYNRLLTEDWGMRAGVSTTRIDETGSASRTSNSVFFSVGRDFTFGF